jgi:hypothetical protein
MRNLEPIPETKFISTARPVIPRIHAAALKLVALANMNRTVHTTTYNNIIAESARQIAAPQ